MTRTRNTVRAALVGGVALAAMSIAQGAYAQNVAFNIPAEDAATALAAWSAATGIKIDAPASLTAGVRTAAVTGEMDTRDALNTMIANTKLQILADDGGLVTLGSAAADTVQKLTVTSSGTNIAGVKAIGSPIQRLTREDLLKTGATSVKEALQTLPLIQMTTNGQTDIGGIGGVSRGGNDNQGTGPTSNGIQSIDIGGQGSRATLVLVDGQRLAHTGENASFTDVTQVPMSALGAIEVIPDGASAIYGTDAISGVINFVIRRNYQGVSVSADYTRDNFAPNYGGAITIGKAWNWLQGGNMLFSYDSHIQQTAYQNSNPYTAQDQRPVGGNLSTNTTPASNLPYITTNACVATNQTQLAVINGSTQVNAGGTITFNSIPITAIDTIPANTCYDAAPAFTGNGGSATSGRVINRTTINYGLPPNWNGATPTLAQLVNYSGTTPQGNSQPGVPLYVPAYIPSDSYSTYLTGSRTQNVLLSLQQKFSDSIDGNLKFSYSLLKSDSNGYRTNNIGLSPTVVGGITNSAVAVTLYPGGSTALTQNSALTNCLPDTVASGQPCPSVTIISPYGRIHGYTGTAQYQNNFALNVALPYNWSAKWTGNMAASRIYHNAGNDPSGLSSVGNATGSSNLRDIYLINGTLSPYSPTYASPVFQSLLGRGTIVPIYRPAIDTQVVLSGPVYNLPGGAVRLSVAAAANYEGNKKTDWSSSALNNGQQLQLGPNSSVEARTQNRGSRITAEVYIPIVGEANAMPGIRNLTLDIAASHSQQARSRSQNTDPTYSWSWKPINDLTLHGTYSTSFRAPDLSESSSGGGDQFYGSISATQSIGLSPSELATLLDKLFQNQGIAGANALDRATNAALLGYDPDPTHYFNGQTPATQTVVFSLGGGVASKNPNLKPEHSTSITATVDYKPSWLSGLSITASYRSLDYKDKIVGLNSGSWLNTALTANVYSSYIYPIARSPNCDPTDPSTYPEFIIGFLPVNGTRFAAQQNSTSRLCDALLTLGSGEVNITGTTQKTATLQASYRFNTQVGTFSADTNFTKILEATQQISPGNNLTQLIDYIGAANSLRGRSSVGWSKGVWSLNVFANYTGAYTNDQRTTLNNRGTLDSSGTKYLVDPCSDHVPIPGGITNNNNGAVGAIPSITNSAYPGSCRLPIYQVPSWTTFDISASYRTNADAPYWARNIRMGLNINNVTGKAPPYAMNGNNVYDPNNANIRGRIYHFTINKDF